MSSPLDLSGNANDDLNGSPYARDQHNKTKKRRDKRHVRVQDTMLTSQDSDVAASAPRAMVNYLGDLAFVMLFNVIMLFFGAIARAFSLMFGNASTSVGNYFSSAEENQLLQEMPVEQRHQKRELEYIRDGQDQHRQQLDDLRRRVQVIEERRKSRAKES